MKTTKEITQAKEEKVKPTNKWSIYPITVTEWTNDKIVSYTIQKSYKDKDGEWQNTESFNESDLCVIAKILTKI